MEGDESLRRIWDRIGHVATAYGLIPTSIMVGLIWFLAWLASFPAVVIALAALIAAVGTAALFRLVTNKRIFWVIVAIIAAGATWFGISQRNNYRLYFDGMEVGLVPSTVDRMSADGGSVTVKIENPNDFQVWLRIDRSTAIMEGVAAEEIETDGPLEVLPLSQFGLQGPKVRFTRPMRPEQITGGRVDYQICYGRSKEDLSKGLLIKFTYQVRFTANQPINVTYSPMVLRDNSCEA